MLSDAELSYLRNKIKKNVPVPPPTTGSQSLYERTYPYSIMEVGDCFELPLFEADKIMAAVSVYKNKAGKDFTRRTYRDQGVARVWRIM